MPRQRKCANCGKPTPPHNNISLNNRYLCARFCNKILACPEFQHIDFDPLLPAKDVDGATHIFHFPLRHLGDRIPIDAFEVSDSPDTDPLALFGKLLQRI